MNADIIMATLEQVADHGDPQERVYARLFEINPEFEQLFALDKGGIVRGDDATDQPGLYCGSR